MCHSWPRRVYMVGQQRWLGQGETAPRPGRSPTHHERACCQIQVDPSPFLVSVGRIMDLGVCPRPSQGSDDLRMAEQFGSSGRSRRNDHVPPAPERSRSSYSGKPVKHQGQNADIHGCWRSSNPRRKSLPEDDVRGRRGDGATIPNRARGVRGHSTEPFSRYQVMDWEDPFQLQHRVRPRVNRPGGRFRAAPAARGLHARMPRTTFPATSVRRMSRP
jgi:hypothetical protein